MIKLNDYRFKKKQTNKNLQNIDCSILSIIWF